MCNSAIQYQLQENISHHQRKLFQQDNLLHIVVFDQAPEIHNCVLQRPLGGYEGFCSSVSLKYNIRITETHESDLYSAYRYLHSIDVIVSSVERDSKEQHVSVG